MAIALEIVDKYFKTLVEFWTLRPRAFLDKADYDPSRYLSPAQFLISTLGVLVVLTVATASFYTELPVEVLERYPMARVGADAKSVAIRIITACVSSLVITSVLVKTTSWLWPIKARVPFSTIVSFQCYYTAILLPIAALELVLTPILLSFVSASRSSNAVLLLFAPAVIGLLSGLGLSLIYFYPGLAKLHAVSTIRMFVGVNIWTCLMGFVLGIGAGVYQILNPEEWRIRNPPEWAFVQQSEAHDAYIGTKTVSQSNSGSVVVLVRFIPRNTTAGKNEKKKIIDELATLATSDSARSKASMFAFELYTFEFQCDKRTYVIRSVAECDEIGNPIRTLDYNTNAEAGFFSLDGYIQKAACNLAQRGSKRP